MANIEGKDKEQILELLEKLSSGELEFTENEKISSWALDFISDQVARYEKYGSDMFISTKQAECIVDICEDLIYEGEE